MRCPHFILKGNPCEKAFYDVIALIHHTKKEHGYVPRYNDSVHPWFFFPTPDSAYIVTGGRLAWPVPEDNTTQDEDDEDDIDLTPRFRVDPNTADQRVIKISHPDLRPSNWKPWMDIEGEDEAHGSTTSGTVGEERSVPPESVNSDDSVIWVPSPCRAAPPVSPVALLDAAVNDDDLDVATPRVAHVPLPASPAETHSYLGEESLCADSNYADEYQALEDDGDTVLATEYSEQGHNDLDDPSTCAGSDQRLPLDNGYFTPFTYYGQHPQQAYRPTYSQIPYTYREPLRVQPPVSALRSTLAQDWNVPLRPISDWSAPTQRQTIYDTGAADFYDDDETDDETESQGEHVAGTDNEPQAEHVQSVTRKFTGEEKHQLAHRGFWRSIDPEQVGNGPAEEEEQAQIATGRQQIRGWFTVVV